MVLARVRRTLRDRSLVDRGMCVVVACSGGPDSMAMLDVLNRLASSLDLSLVVAAVDHGLRPEAAGEILLVKERAGSLGWPFHALRVDASGTSGVQARARVLRYRALIDLAAREGASRIAVGHTMDDQAETVLAHLLRGAGLEGMRGISARRADGVIRPLIDCRRAEARAHLARYGLSFAEDASNTDPRYKRVRIRHRVLRHLAAEDPEIVKHLAELADDARSAVAVLAELARSVHIDAAGGAPFAHADGAGPSLALSRVRDAPEAVRRRVFRRFLGQFHDQTPKRAHLDGLSRLVERGRGTVLVGSRVVVVREGFLVVQARAGHTRSTRL